MLSSPNKFYSKQKFVSSLTILVGFPGGWNNWTQIKLFDIEAIRIHAVVATYTEKAPLDQCTLKNLQPVSETRYSIERVP